MRGENAEILGFELEGRAQDYAKHFIANRLRALDLAASAARWARLAQHVRQAFARALARHFHQAELREAVHRDARAVARQRLVEFCEQGVAVLFAIHVDEIGNDDAAQVAQTQLPRDGLRRLEVGLEYGVVETAPAHERPGVHVHRRQRLGLVEDHIAARLELDAALQRALDLFLSAEQVEQRR